MRYLDWTLWVQLQVPRVPVATQARTAPKCGRALLHSLMCWLLAVSILRSFVPPRTLVSASGLCVWLEIGGYRSDVSVGLKFFFTSPAVLRPPKPEC